MRSLYDVVKRPIISEKSAALAEVGGRYTFEVDSKATKDEVKDAVSQLFKVKVRKVNTAIVHGKVKRAGASYKKRSNWKKAIVTLEDGQRIDFYQAN
ncbi:MAG: 50S ribosomal protein L23 [Bdellovibrionaceae bacterium]|nr:50S ribosomal protein L23 [Pseudobdellovibrionaceae bacterium]|tara:strand:- start:1084 stop:1374 length:291 start_codon:yes stop_codon:yes gene_type:complete